MIAGQTEALLNTYLIITGDAYNKDHRVNPGSFRADGVVNISFKLSTRMSWLSEWLGVKETQVEKEGEEIIIKAEAE